MNPDQVSDPVERLDPEGHPTAKRLRVLAGGVAFGESVLMTGAELRRTASVIDELSALLPSEGENARLKKLLREAWEFPEKPGPANGEMADEEVWSEQEKWLDVWDALDRSIQAALDDPSPAPSENARLRELGDEAWKRDEKWSSAQFHRLASAPGGEDAARLREALERFIEQIAGPVGRLRLLGARADADRLYDAIKEARSALHPSEER